MMCTLILNMCVVGLVEVAPDMYKLELFDGGDSHRHPTTVAVGTALNIREYVLIRAEPDKK